MHEFWQLTPKQFEKYIKAYSKKKQEELETKDMLNWILGKYIAYSFNEPKKYPRKPTFKDTSTSEMTAEEMERRAMLNCMKMGGEIQNGI